MLHAVALYVYIAGKPIGFPNAVFKTRQLCSKHILTEDLMYRDSFTPNVRIVCKDVFFSLRPRPRPDSPTPSKH